MQRKYLQNINKIVWITVILFLGFNIGLNAAKIVQEPLPLFTFKKDISLGEIANFVITLLVVFYFNKAINNSRIEKDLLISDIHEVEKEIKEQMSTVLRHHVNSREISKKDADKLLLRVKGVSQCIVRIAECTQKYSSNEAFQESIKELLALQMKYWEDLTTDLGGKHPIITSKTYLKTSKNVNNYLTELLKVRLLINEF